MNARRDRFAALVDEHFYDTGWRCACGWTGSCEDWVEHFAAILDAESGEWMEPVSDTDRILTTGRRVLTDGCQSCGMSHVYCRCVAWIEGDPARCCDTCSH